MNSIEEQIKATLDKIRPFIQRDGGDVEFLTYEDGIVYIKMLGACANCVAQDETVSSGIEMILVDEVPGVLHVKVVSE
jgi:Fe-S cluster biogenesis protein NfuA